jgi:hypothetical protein
VYGKDRTLSKVILSKEGVQQGTFRMATEPPASLPLSSAFGDALLSPPSHAHASDVILHAVPKTAHSANFSNSNFAVTSDDKTEKPSVSSTGTISASSDAALASFDAVDKKSSADPVSSSCDAKSDVTSVAVAPNASDQGAKFTAREIGMTNSRFPPSPPLDELVADPTSTQLVFDVDVYGMGPKLARPIDPASNLALLNNVLHKLCDGRFNYSKKDPMPGFTQNQVQVFLVPRPRSA